MEKDRFVIYTALFGEYDSLRDVSVPLRETIDLVCFTNNRNLVSKTWKIVYVEGKDGLDNHMMNRLYKFFPHVYLANYSRSLYIDANIEIIGDVLKLSNKYLGDFDIAAPIHADRYCIYQEAESIKLKGLAPDDEIDRQVQDYKDKNYPCNYGLLEMNVILRNHKSDCIAKLMDEWWDCINLYTRRDQLSFKYSCWKLGVEPGVMSESTRRANPFFIKFRHIKKNPRLIDSIKYRLQSSLRKLAYKYSKYDY
jgi:hypothetical protein